MSIKPDCLWDEIALAGKELCRKKQQDYGPHSISNTGNIGVAVRLNDKVTRLLNLIQKMDKGDEPPHWESIRDTYTDIMNYAVIGLLLLDGKWADKVSMREIFGEDDDGLDQDLECEWSIPARTKVGSFPATLGECKVRPVLDLDDEDFDPITGDWGVAKDKVEVRCPSDPNFDWSPYIGKYVLVHFKTKRNSYTDSGVLSIGLLREYITLHGRRWSVKSVEKVELLDA